MLTTSTRLRTLTPLCYGQFPSKISSSWQNRARGLSTSHPPQHIPVIRTLAQLRRWRRTARQRGLEVGVVPTMGALHEGHLNLVRTSLNRHPLTVMTVFVNPMQFAPHEDFGAYPRQLERDLSLLNTLLPSSNSLPPALRGLGISENDAYRPTFAPSSTSSSGGGEDGKLKEAAESPLVVFAPNADVIYPLKGELQDLSAHRGVEIDVKGWGDLMEGVSRPQFFKGVATVCTKLFNAVEPDHAYFGQKDIQQALLLKILVQDLLLSHPTPSNLHIVPTTRSPSGLALSSRNAYLSPPELLVAPILYQALQTGVDAFEGHDPSSATLTAEDIIAQATSVILNEQLRIAKAAPEEGGGVELELDYIELFDKTTFNPVRGDVTGKEMVLAGAVWVGKTRLIDNLLLGWKL
ncbi:pantoate-beta-alanine ligase [Cryptococcus gattii E566]|uniref:Pantoate--beta-alanine ligase n=3 Tax=Cryptococcus gattii species complex TaxID=1884637 RepID=E6RBV0_CRYGW|nr:PAN6 Pantoate-beta-alanine ligase, putative [Cryptococcus gattii WM276]AAV28751.1 PAN6p [Cryptococcus gattii]KIR76391.1 pantoate-beta-alanine ligase [Cryptococcus gattii EJB2]KIY32383.1 pantoate-beta-alanine ligase [Cryptococcus gattii E566]KJE02488.1 pantoate-beta-alanine ligase [Cryptococcus gattii NT-10]AAV28785.1 PAN6p [Cryptococcus gattii]